MPARPERLLRHIRRLVQRPGPDPSSDAALLQRFTAHRDEEAFAALVRRHGPLVLGACRRVLRDLHEAEEVSQAVWLVLARKAASVRPPGRLAAWLHGVAHHLALNARRAAARRRRHEAGGIHREPAAAKADLLDELSARELLLVLDEELQRLPAAYRLPLIHCALEGRTTEEAARQLGWTPGSVRGRLVRGRALLHARLVRRGLALPATLAVVEAARGLAPAAMPAGLAGQVARAAAAFAAGRPAALGELSGRVAVLAESALEGMAMAKPKWGLALALLAGVVLTAAGVAHQVRSAGQPDEGTAIVPAPAAAEPGEKARPARKDLYGDALPDGAVARLGTVRFNHGNGLNSLFFSADGQRVISHGGGFLRIWDAATGQEQAQFALPRRWADDQAALSPDGKTLILLAQEFPSDALSVWDLTAGKELRSVKMPVQRREISAFRRNALSPDGRLGALHTPEEVRVFEVATARELCRIPAGGRALQDVVFAGKDRLVTADKKGTLEVWDARTGKSVRRFEQGSPAVVLAVSADGARLATLEHHTHAIDRYLDRDVVHLWDLGAGTRKHTLTARPGRWFMAVSFSPDGKLLLACSVGAVAAEVTAWDVETGRRVRELDGAYGNTLAASPDGGRVAAGGTLGKFELWDLKTGRCLSPGGGSRPVDAVFLAPAGDRVFTLEPSSVNTWDGTTGRRLHSFEVPACPFGGLEYSHSPDGRYAIHFAVDLDQRRVEILVWDVVAHRRLHALRVPGSPYDIRSAFSPDSSLLAAWHRGKEAGQGIVCLWEVRTGNEIRSFQEARVGSCKRLSFTADGKTLLAAGRGVVGLDVAGGKELFFCRMESLKSQFPVGVAPVGGAPVENEDPWRTVAVSPDGSLFAGVLPAGFSRERLEERLVLGEVRTGKVLRRWDDSGLPGSSYEQLEFSPDGRLLASSDGEVVRVWDVLAGKGVYRFEGHRGEVRSLAFSANNRRLASASYDATVLLWDLTGKSGAAAVQAGEPGEKDVAGWWADLAGEDARRAQAAVWRLAEAPGVSVPFLRPRLRPATDAQRKQIRQHIADLDSETFGVRQRAFEQLGDLGPAAAGELREALKGDVSAEVRRRVEELLERATRPPTGAALRTLRALAVLEHAGVPEALRLLGELRDGAPGTWLTQQARAIRVRHLHGARRRSDE
jgi:RNA polymerase sigma factor (sigma-70 family)